MPYDFYCDEVLNGRTQVKKVIETANVLAFHHTSPSWPVHIMIIPKFHVDSFLTFLDENDALLREMMSVLKEVITLVTKEQGGCRLTTNFGNCQQTKHLHWHVYVGKIMGQNSLAE